MHLIKLEVVGRVILPRYHEEMGVTSYKKLQSVSIEILTSDFLKPIK